MARWARAPKLASFEHTAVCKAGLGGVLGTSASAVPASVAEAATTALLGILAGRRYTLRH